MKVLFCFLALSVALACGTVVQVIDCGGKSIILYLYIYIYFCLKLLIRSMVKPSLPFTFLTTMTCFFFQAEDGIRDRSPSRGLGDVYKRQE